MLMIINNLKLGRGMGIATSSSGSHVRAELAASAGRSYQTLGTPLGFVWQIGRLCQSIVAPGFSPECAAQKGGTTINAISRRSTRLGRSESCTFWTEFGGGPPLQVLQARLMSKLMRADCLPQWAGSGRGLWSARRHWRFCSEMSNLKSGNP